MDRAESSHAAAEEHGGRLFHAFPQQGAFRRAELQTADGSRLDLVDDEIVGVRKTGADDLPETVALFGDHVHRRFVPLAAQSVEDAGRDDAVFGIRPVQLVEQEQVAQMENPGRGFHTRDLFGAEAGVGAAEMEEGAAAAVDLRHDVGVGGGAVVERQHVAPVDAAAVDFAQDVVAERVAADAAAGIERKVRAEACQIGQHVVRAAAQSGFDAGDGRQVAPCGIPLDDLDVVNQPVAGRNDSFSFHDTGRFRLCRRFRRAGCAPRRPVGKLR